jgi:hypothetical protein
MTITSPIPSALREQPLAATRRAEAEAWRLRRTTNRKGAGAVPFIGGSQRK